jgi:hypothetical protein
VTGLSREVLAELVAELGSRGQARRDASLTDRPRQRAVGAGARHRLVFVDRLLATLVHLRHGVTHDVLACWFRSPGRRSPGRSVRSARCWPDADAPSPTGSDCAPWPTWSPSWAPEGKSACSMPPRSVPHDARRWEPKRLRLRLLTIPARHARTGRRRLLHLAATAPFTALALHALAALAHLTARPAPG